MCGCLLAGRFRQGDQLVESRSFSKARAYGQCVPDHLLTVLAPMLTNRPQRRFNVFDVMHHGTHEKQLSNVFAWLLKADATHGLGGAFQGIFVKEVNRQLGEMGKERVADQAFGVRQEKNTARDGEREDIADIVLDGDDTTIVIENYGVPDGHGHSYQGYLDFGARQTRNSVVVLLCESELGGALVDGWEKAPVVLYATLLNRVYEHVQQLSKYRSEYVEQYYFIENMHRHFTNRMALTMNREGLMEFVGALCSGGEAERFGQRDQGAVARELADRLREEAIQRYSEGRELLGKAKTILRDYCDATLSQQVNETLGRNVLGKARVPWAGIHTWTVSIAPHPDFADRAEGTYVAHLVLGPSAWYEVTKGRWQGTAIQPDFTRLLLLDDRTGGQVVSSAVSIAKVLEGLGAEDTRRLRDEMVSLLQP